MIPIVSDGAPAQFINQTVGALPATRLLFDFMENYRDLQQLRIHIETTTEQSTSMATVCLLK